VERIPRVISVEHLSARVLRVTFNDGLVRELDFEGALPGILATVDDDTVFATVTVDTVAGTIAWPVGIDLDPDVLHGDAAAASAPPPRLLREYSLQQTRERRADHRLTSGAAHSKAPERSLPPARRGFARLGVVPNPTRRHARGSAHPSPRRAILSVTVLTDSGRAWA
jgi:hypothetical protein